ncbi:hypothetical protein FNF29_05558 [Cafeteria roenbergensis]|uniref:Uncharacterized protein n=1 Tax=Cafeteria roenbergensis TaxID=33653 RepID=A0A5A8CBA1_CAFRO|nr:hypothetical protein FNF29_05558 [Cafeteria roenbergensis]|eukprot:KAA0150118.1 hypothetical protein FNF29_05558 [Cafeteria roenbergensis]
MADAAHHSDGEHDEELSSPSLALTGAALDSLADAVGVLYGAPSAAATAPTPAADAAEEVHEGAKKPMTKADKILAKADMSSAAIREIVAKIQDSRASARARAARYGEPYTEPRWESFLTKKELLRLVRQQRQVHESGIDMASEEEAERRAKRAAVFGAAAPSARAATLTGQPVDPRDPASMRRAAEAVREAEAKRLGGSAMATVSAVEFAAKAAEEAAQDPRREEERRRRAARFNTALPEDKEKAEAAAEALLRLPGEAAGSRDLEAVRARWTEEQVMEGAAMLGGGGDRPEAVHVVANGYIRAGDRDVFKLFDGYRPSFVEWLNSETLNVVFETADDAARALNAIGRPIPSAPGVPSVPAVWREAERPLVKGKSDKWARKGATTRVWLRPATADDVESKAVSTAGARTHGLLGENIRRKEAQANREARMLRAQERAQQRALDKLLELDPRVQDRTAGLADGGARRHVVLHGAAGAGPAPALHSLSQPSVAVAVSPASLLPPGPLSFVKRKPAQAAARAGSPATAQAASPEEDQPAAATEAGSRERHGAFGGAVRRAKRGRGAARSPSPTAAAPGAAAAAPGASDAVADLDSTAKRAKAEGAADAGVATAE